MDPVLHSFTVFLFVNRENTEKQSPQSGEYTSECGLTGVWVVS